MRCNRDKSNSNCKFSIYFRQTQVDKHFLTKVVSDCIKINNLLLNRLNEHRFFDET